MTMKQEQIVEGVYVRWIAERLHQSWNVMGKIVRVFEETIEEMSFTKVSILSFDDMGIVTISMKTAMEEFVASSRDEAAREIDSMILHRQKKLLDLEFSMKQLRYHIKDLEEIQKSL